MTDFSDIKVGDKVLVSTIYGKIKASVISVTTNQFTAQTDYCRKIRFFKNSGICCTDGLIRATEVIKS